MNRWRVESKILVVLITLLVVTVELFAQTKKVKSILSNKHFNWKTDTIGVKNFWVYYEEGGWAEANKDKMKSLLRNSYKEVTKMISLASYDYPIYYFVLNSREKTKYIAGHETNGASIGDQDIYFAVYNGKINALGNHEFFHGIAYRTLGKCKELWINEGLAVAADNAWAGYSLHALANYFKKNNKLIPISVLADAFSKQNDRISYPEAGSFFKYLLEHHNRDHVRQFWKGTSTIEESTGKSLRELEADWLAEISKYETDHIRYSFE